VLRLADEGLQRAEIAEMLGIGVASVYRMLADVKKCSGERHTMHHPMRCRIRYSSEMRIANRRLSCRLT